MGWGGPTYVTCWSRQRPRPPLDDMPWCRGDARTQFRPSSCKKPRGHLKLVKRYLRDRRDCVRLSGRGGGSEKACKGMCTSASARVCVGLPACLHVSVHAQNCCWWAPAWLRLRLEQSYVQLWFPSTHSWTLTHSLSGAAHSTPQGCDLQPADTWLPRKRLSQHSSL